MKFPIQPNNPILQRELLHQKRSISPWVWRIELLGVIAIPLLLSPILIMNAFQMDGFFSYYRFYLPPRHTTLQVLLPLIWIIHALTALRAIMTGAHAMSRDYQQGVWDELRLTGVTARKILIGKWWASLYRIRGWVVALGLIQMVIIPIFITEFTFNTYGRAFGEVVWCIRNYSSSSDTCIQNSSSYQWQTNLWTWAEIPTSVTTAIFFTLLEAAVSTAVGLAAGIMTRVASVAATIGLIIRFLPVLIFSFFPDYPNASGAFFWRWHEYTWFAFADGGTSAVMRIIAPVFFNREWQAFVAATGLLSAFLIGAVFTVLVVLRRNGVSWRS